VVLLRDRQPRLLDQLREALRSRHYSRRTEQTYCQWVKRFIYFHNVRHPKDMAETEINAFLTHLAVREKVTASTQNQALSALLFLYRHVIGREVGDLGEAIRARKPMRVPVVMTREEVKSVLANLTGDKWLLASLMYGAGLHLMECLRLRVQDIDFSRNEIIVRDGKGAKDRITMLPESLKSPASGPPQEGQGDSRGRPGPGLGSCSDADGPRPEVSQRPEGMVLAVGLSPGKPVAEYADWRIGAESCG
jgi:site-specific recombinase XerD